MELTIEFLEKKLAEQDDNLAGRTFLLTGDGSAIINYYNGDGFTRGFSVRVQVKLNAEYCEWPLFYITTEEEFDMIYRLFNK